MKEIEGNRANKFIGEEEVEKRRMVVEFKGEILQSNGGVWRCHHQHWYPDGRLYLLSRSL